jgi:REP element-mobilizing transposase RayT
MPLETTQPNIRARSTGMPSSGPSRRGPRQGELQFRSWGGPRPGAGRRPNGAKAGVPHATRGKLSRHHPVHTTVRLITGLPSLRRKETLAELRTAFRKGSERFGFRLLHYSVQSSHLHFIVEAKDRVALTRGMQGLLIRIARALNRLWQRKGKVFAERFHQQILKSPTQLRRALVYVLNNYFHHGQRPRKDLDRFASGPWFEGWKERFTVKGIDHVPRHLAAPRTWLMTDGWRKLGRIRLDEAPLPQLFAVNKKPRRSLR